MASSTTEVDKSEAAVQYARQAEHLSLLPRGGNQEEVEKTTAQKAVYITPADAVIELADGERLPTVPLSEAEKLNTLKAKSEGRTTDDQVLSNGQMLRSQSRQSVVDGQEKSSEGSEEEHIQGEPDAGASLSTATPPSKTNPLFPPLPLYGPPSLMRDIHCYCFRFTSFFLSLGFLAVIVLGSAFTSLPLMFQHIGMRLKLQNPSSRRPFYLKEEQRKKARKEAERQWRHDRRRRAGSFRAGTDDKEETTGHTEEFVPTEGGPDPLVCDVEYYARRVGLCSETFKVQTEDGFIIDLWHLYNPKEYTPATEEERGYRKPVVFSENPMNGPPLRSRSRYRGLKRYPILMMHGLLQSAGAYCTNDDDSLAFFLAKSGYDVFLGNNRCGFSPDHKNIKPADPRFWAWNIRQMGVLDLPALVSRVLAETGFEKLGLVCHSQGTAEAFVAFAKQQRPDLGQKISVFCSLAPAVYAGRLISKAQFKFFRIMNPSMFRVFFGIHAFIPFMMKMHAILPGNLYGALGYRVFAFLFNWTDDRWERDLRDRMFQFAPVYVSAEAMRWWLGRECFARHRCILATKQESREEDKEDEEDDDIEDVGKNDDHDFKPKYLSPDTHRRHHATDQGRRAWYDENVPPMALWVAGSDELVDGARLLRRFERGREPHVNVVYSKVIPEYEHLDVLWAMDVIEKVGLDLRNVLWKTAEGARDGCLVPKGCEAL